LVSAGEGMVERRFLFIFVGVAIVVLCIYAYLLATIPKSEGSSYYRELATGIHSQFKTMMNEAKAAFPGPEYIDLNNPEERMKLNIYLSLMDDMSWVAKKENTYYNAIMNAKETKQIKKLTKSEIACGILMQYILELNLSFKDFNMPKKNLVQKYVAGAEKQLQNVSSFTMSSDILAGFKEYTGVKVEEIKNELDGLFRDYAEHLGASMHSAGVSGNIEREYIEAKKIIIIST